MTSPPSVCTQTFIAFYTDKKEQAESIQSYYITKFFRFIVSLRKITQSAFRHTYSWVPIQTWIESGQIAIYIKNIKSVKKRLIILNQ